MLPSLRRCLGSGRLHLLSEHGRAALLGEAVAAYGPAAGLGLVQSLLPAGQQGRAFSAAGQEPFEDVEAELTLPEDLSVIARLNPELRDVMLAHQQQARWGGMEHWLVSASFLSERRLAPLGRQE